MSVVTGLDKLTPASVAWLYPNIPQPPSPPSHLVAHVCRCGNEHVCRREIPAVEWRRYVRDVEAWEKSLPPETLEHLRRVCTPHNEHKP